MTAAIFVVSGIAMMSAASGRRDVAIGLFGIALVASILWLDHLMTGHLGMAF